MRQNTRALKAASWQQVVAGAREASRMRSDPARAPAWSRGLSYHPDLPTEDLATFSGVVTDEALFFQGVFALYQKNQLDFEVYQAYLQWFASIIATPGGDRWWHMIAKPIFVPEKVRAVDERLGQGGLADIRRLPGLGPDAWAANTGAGQFQAR